MQISAGMELLAIGLTFFVHLIGAGVLVWALIDSDDADAGSWRDWWPRDSDGPEPTAGPRGPAGTERPPVPAVERPLLPDAQPAAVRLREPSRLADHKPAPARRPGHPAAPERPVRA